MPTSYAGGADFASWRPGCQPRITPGPVGLVDIEERVRSLDQHRRSAFLLTQWFGLSCAEAAEMCGCRVGTIRSRVARAGADLMELSEGSCRRTSD